MPDRFDKNSGYKMSVVLLEEILIVALFPENKIMGEYRIWHDGNTTECPKLA